MDHLYVNVRLVVLYAPVRDREGRLASGLREHGCELYEDGVRQSIRLFPHEDIPVTVGLVVDDSSSSMRRKLADVIAAARTFVQSSRPEDEMLAVNFSENVTLRLPDAIRLTPRSDEPARAISNTPATGQTALYDAVVEARERLDKKVPIVVSDGGGNAGQPGADRVWSTRIVGPSDVAVPDAGGNEILTVVTCYPFYFVCPALNRSIVRAERVGTTS